MTSKELKMKSLEKVQESLEDSVRIAQKNYRKSLAADKSDAIVTEFHRYYLVKKAELRGFNSAYSIMLGVCSE